MTDIPPARRHPGWVGDAAAAALALAVLLAVAPLVPARSPDRPLDALGYLLLVAAGMAMGMCRRWPRAATGVATVVLAVFVARRYPDDPVWLTGWISLAALGWRASRRTALALTAAMLAMLTFAALAVGHRGPLLPLVFAGWAAAAVFAGQAVASRRSYLAGLVERARFLERTREEETRRRIAEDRLRIARDLHDSVAHAMATINVQAGAAAHVLERRPAAAGEALAVIRRASGEVLDELNAMVAVLRDDVQPPDRAPVPGLAQVPRLAEAAQASGLTIGLSMDGPVAAVPGVRGTAAYRVVQESLTNVARHSQAATAVVHITADGHGGLTVEIRDPGPAAQPGTGGAGVGIRGMTERVTSTGGHLAAGPQRHGGFAVRAVWDGRP